MADNQSGNLLVIMNALLHCIILILAGHGFGIVDALLYPHETETREVKDLSGRWKFRVDDSPNRNEGFKQSWWKEPLQNSGCIMDMPVPASYNDITQNKTIRDFVGWAWYEKTFIAPSSWSGKLVWLRFGSAHYHAVVWLNGNKIMEHEGGHLPFEAEVSSFVHFRASNRITVAVNNTLTPTTIPPGKITYYNDETMYPPGYFVQDYQFDFFNYAGIHRPVKLYTTEKLFVKDIQIKTFCKIDYSECNVCYNVTTNSVLSNITVTVLNSDVIVTTNKAGACLTVISPTLWWPVGMSDRVGHLYTLQVQIHKGNVVTDVYRLQFGIRTIEILGDKFLINGQRFYFIGVGKHEDWDVRGKGFDWSMVIKDFNMLEWIGANSFRTSHYPYAEEIMQLCDERGIVVIDEAPAVGMRYVDNYVNTTLQHHLEVMEELINRDKNHPSVIMWSIANEPSSNLPQSEGYFKKVFEKVRALDKTRPVTFVCNEPPDKDLATAFVDVVCVNKYVSWYEDCGHTEVIQRKLGNFLSQWQQKRNKPVIHMEWGAGTIAGFHGDPSVMFTEEYQEEVMEEHFATFDKYRQTFLVGEMIWNFADFATQQGTKRVAGNKKGVLTRQRNPKSAAKIIRTRYHALRKEYVAKPTITDSKDMKNNKF